MSTFDVDQYIRQKQYRLINSILVMKDGEIKFESYYNQFNSSTRNHIKSIWKSIIAICIGICIDQHLIKNVDEPVYHFIPMLDGRIQPSHRMITVRHLLTMTSGIYWNGGVKYHCPMLGQMMKAKSIIEHIANIQMTSYPGMSYQYKETDVILASEVIHQASGKNSFEFCNQYLYQPLGIQSQAWYTSSCGVTYNIGITEEDQKASDLTARELLRIGELFLNRGYYNGRCILSEQFVKDAITPSEKNEGYGFFWWLFPNGIYGCSGYGGQEIKVVPAKQLVYVIQATATPRCKSYDELFYKLLEVYD